MNQTVQAMLQPEEKKTEAKFQESVMKAANQRKTDFENINARSAQGGILSEKHELLKKEDDQSACLYKRSVAAAEATRLTEATETEQRRYDYTVVLIGQQQVKKLAEKSAAAALVIAKADACIRGGASGTGSSGSTGSTGSTGGSGATGAVGNAWRAAGAADYVPTSVNLSKSKKPRSAETTCGSGGSGGVGGSGAADCAPESASVNPPKSKKPRSAEAACGVGGSGASLVDELLFYELSADEQMKLAIKQSQLESDAAYAKKLQQEYAASGR
jgi:hypothetical protein